METVVRLRLLARGVGFAIEVLSGDCNLLKIVLDLDTK